MTQSHAKVRTRESSLAALPHRLHAFCDQATGCLLTGMLIFGPWAFGTTQPWSLWVMNAGGLAVGSLLLLKWAIRRFSGYHPAVWGQAEIERTSDPLVERNRPLTGGNLRTCAPSDWITKSLGVVTALVLTYCLVSAVNARSTLTADHLQYDYRRCLVWLPHSYDATLTWVAFWKYLALASMFWAARDWLLVKSPADCAALKNEAAKSALERGCFVPRRLHLLLWIMCLNGALLAGEGLLQRALGGGKLLWLVEPQLNRTPESQFGPYAYRSNAAQYFLLMWPLAAGFWWLLRRRAHYLSTRLSGYNNLLACILLMALVPLMSLSRAGAVLGVFTVIAALGLLVSGRGSHGKRTWGLAALLGAALLLGSFVEWRQLDSRFRLESLDSQRFQIWRNTWQIVRDLPVFGTGPGTFRSVYQLYRASVFDEWDAYAHNDWLETLMTFGAAGTVLVLLALGLVVALRFAGKGVYLHRFFAYFIYLGMGSCLLYGVVDFPFQVHSVLFLFLVEAAILSCLSRTP